MSPVEIVLDKDLWLLSLAAGLFNSKPFSNDKFDENVTEGRDLFAYNEADFVLLEGTTCMLPVGLQKGGEPISLYFAKACCYWKSIHVRSYSTCLQTAEFFILWYDEGIIFKKNFKETKNLFTPPLYIDFHHCILSFCFCFGVLCLGYAWTRFKYMFRADGCIQV